jgi:non-lysosomal glucosylceramidase
MSEEGKVPRRSFLKQAAGALGAATQLREWPALAEGKTPNAAESRPGTSQPHTSPSAEIKYPRVFRGAQLKTISFPLGGVAAGSLGLGGRGQLRDWEIFNRPNQGHSPSYAFPAIWVKAGDAKPIARVLEARILPPYQGQDGLGSNNAPGLVRLESAEFTGEYPLAYIKFQDASLPVAVELEAFSPFIPHDPDDSGLPVAVLRYRVTNNGVSTAKVSIVFSIDNPVAAASSQDHAKPTEDQRQNEYRSATELVGFLMTNPAVAKDDPMFGSFALAAIPAVNVRLTQWRGWPKGRWWNSPLLFWDAFSAQGELGIEPDPHNAVAALCQQCTIQAGQSEVFTFVLSWHFPNRTPSWCGWDAPEGKGDTVIGNYCATRFKDAWQAAQYAASNLEHLESRTRLFAKAMRESTLPDVVKEAASANLSTLASTTCFRTADGEFHGFEGSDDSRGCCFGNCTHVWNYETATTFLFPSFARSLRKASFGYSMDDAGGMRFRQLLPDGYARFGFAAADGQMGQIMHAYLDWKLSGDDAWARTMWPRMQKAIAFAWQPGGWDANRRGVLTGVQHNTYDVEFYGPNPMCSIWYLGALRSCEEMGRALGDHTAATEYRKLFDQGSQWIDANLFNGSFYIQQIVGYPQSRIAPNLQSDMGSENTVSPEYQVGQGCLIDQLIGQYLAEVAGLGPLVASSHIRETLQSLYRYNYKRSLVDHANVERTFALNDEAAMVICDYATAARPHIPFPYYAEVMTGFEHSAAALMIFSGMVDEGIECIHNIRSRYDGEKRNPWDEAECGHHYARAMASWTSLVALSGFSYDGVQAAIVAVPRQPHAEFHCFWASGTGWGTFSYVRGKAGSTRFTLNVISGTLPCRSCQITSSGKASTARLHGKSLTHALDKQADRCTLRFSELVPLKEGDALVIEVTA